LVHIKVEIEFRVIYILFYFISCDKDILATYLRCKDKYMTLFSPVLVLVPTLVYEPVGDS